MRYVYDYLYLSLAFLSLIAYRFFTQRQFPSLRNRLFSAIIITAFVDLLLDIFSSVVIERALVIAPWLTHSVCYLFYTVQSVFPVLLSIYVFTLAHRRPWLRCPGLLLVLLPTVLSLLLLYSNFFTRQIFYVDPVAGYVHGPLFIVLYVNSFLYIGITLITTLRNRDRFIPLERQTVLVFLAILTTMIVVQYILQSYLVSGASIALALTLMYIVMQKPEDMIDAISGAFNHSAFMVFTQSSIDDGKSFSLILLDLMHMRRINRLFGVDFGSKTLEAVAREMNAAAHGGWVFRTSGNVFVLANASLEAHRRAYADLCDHFDQEIGITGVSMQLTATILSLPDVSAIRSVDDLNECLESVLNTATRGEYQVIPKELLFSDQRHEAVEDALLRAVKEERIYPVLQPIYSLRQNRFVTAEALARFHDEALGDIPPGEFIPIAEKNGLILPLDRLMIQKVCRFLKETESDLLAVEINLSPVEFINEQLCARIIETVREFEVDPSRIWFEITETSTNVDLNLLSTYMNRLCAEGFRFALDDYGVGYSNISRIMNLPFSLVKLDRSMLLASTTDSRRALVLKRTVQMLRDLKLSTLIEGVETAEQAREMCKLGIDYIQGFYYASPMPMECVPAFLRRCNGAASETIDLPLPTPTSPA